MRRLWTAFLTAVLAFSLLGCQSDAIHRFDFAAQEVTVTLRCDKAWGVTEESGEEHSSIHLWENSQNEHYLGGISVIRMDAASLEETADKMIPAAWNLRRIDAGDHLLLMTDQNGENSQFLYWDADAGVCLISRFPAPSLELHTVRALGESVVITPMPKS